MRAPTRREALILLGSAPLAHAVRAEPSPPRDQGIGGTGARPEAPPEDSPGGGEDRGIGGTGVIGTIRRFGSIVVNDLRITYPKTVAVRIDGAPASASDLRIGQVVRVVAHADGAALSTRRIDVLSEVVGPVEAVAKGTMRVLGQRIAVPKGMSGAWKPGDRVAVSGLRRPDGVVVASLIEARDAGPSQVAGRIRASAGGGATIGNLPLYGVDPKAVGHRAVVTGEPKGSGLAVTRVEEARTLFVPGLRRVSIEAYVGRNGRGLHLGSGLEISGASDASLPRRGSVRAIVTAEAGRGGQLTLERLRIDDRGSGPGRAPEGGGFERAPRLEPPHRDMLRPDGFRSAPQPLDIDSRVPGGGGANGFGGPRGETGGGFGGGHGGLGRGPGGFGGPGGGGPGGPGGGPGRR